MVCLDTTVLADLARGKPSARRIVDALEGAGERLMTTVVTVGELYYGAWAHVRPEAKTREVVVLIEGLIVLEMNLRAAEIYGRLKAQLRRRGQMVGDRDLLSAAIALAYGENRVVTRNVRDFERIPGIQVAAY